MKTDLFNELVESVHEGGLILKGRAMSEDEYNATMTEIDHLMTDFDQAASADERANVSRRTNELATMCEAWENIQPWWIEFMEGRE